MSKLSLASAAIALALVARVVPAQQDGLVAFPETYRVQFENEWVRLIRVTLAGNARLGEHSHPPGVMVHVYLNDAAPVLFAHDGPPGDITRPAVVARSYRTGRATPEVHGVVNTSPNMSDYMRVELKTRGDNAQRQRIAAPPIPNETASAVEVQNPQYRVTRVTIAAGQSTTLTATATEPAILLAVTAGVSAADGNALKIGQERFIPVSQRETLRNSGTTPVQLLRIDFLTPPM